MTDKERRDDHLSYKLFDRVETVFTELAAIGAVLDALDVLDTLVFIVFEFVFFEEFFSIFFTSCELYGFFVVPSLTGLFDLVGVALVGVVF